MTTSHTYTVPGMSCEHCRTAIETSVGRVPGVLAIEVDLDAKQVAVTGDGTVDDARVVAAIDDAGYDVA